MSKSSKVISITKAAAPLLVLAALGGCADGWRGEFDDVYVPTSHTERFPIDVVKGRVRLNVPTARARMTEGQIDSVTRFAQQARSSRAQFVSIQRPGGNVNADVIAGRITQIMAEQGLTASQLRHSTYRGKYGSPVSLTFVRSFARTKKCGNWPADFTDTHQNRPHADFGCAYQHNVAAQIANPKDLIKPRTSTPSDAMRRHRVFDDYRTPKSPTTPADDNSKVSTTDAGKQ